MESITAPVVVRTPTDGIRVASMGNVYRMVVTGEETEGRFSLMETFIKPGEGGPYHIHSHEDESFLVTQGEMIFYDGTKRIVAKQGTFVMCPPGSMRGFRNETNEQAKMMIFYTPPGIENMIQLDGEIVGSDVEKIKIEGARSNVCPQLSGEYGIEDIDTPLPETKFIAQ